MEAESVPQTECFDAGGPVRPHRGDRARPRVDPCDRGGGPRGEPRPPKAGDDRVILIALSGHGHFDLAAYDDYLNGRMVDLETPDVNFESSLAELPTI